MDVTVLTPLGALIAVVVVVPLVALALLHRRGDVGPASDRLPEPRPRVVRAAVAALVVGAALLGLAAAQPRIEWTSDKRVRDDAEAIVVIDTSRSMLARTSPRSRIRYARANAAALRFRAAFDDVPVGIASFTDRVLPHLFPSPDEDVFAATLGGRSGSIGRRRKGLSSRPRPARRARDDRQPPLLHADRAQPADLRDHRRRERADRRCEDAAAFRRPPGVDTIFLHVWNGDERVFDGNQVEPQYSPDPRSRGDPRRRRRHARWQGLLRERARRRRSRPPGTSSVTARRSCRGRSGTGSRWRLTSPGRSSCRSRSCSGGATARPLDQPCGSSNAWNQSSTASG